jgi:hypothetical protein
VSVVWQAVDALAKTPLKREELDRNGVQDVLAAFDVFTPVRIVQRSHGPLTLEQLFFYV